MKILFYRLLQLIVACSSLSCGAQNSSQLPPKWKATVRVFDEGGLPVSNANVKVWYHIPPLPNQTIAMTNKAGLTDISGSFVASERSRSVELDCEAFKNGYY